MILKELPLRLITEPERELRSRMVEEKLEALADSVDKKSKKAPIKVIPEASEESEVTDLDQEGFQEWVENYEGPWEIIHGHRRYIARKREGDQYLYCILSNEPREEAVLDRAKENIYREDVNPIDEGRYLRWMMANQDITQEKLAQNLGKSEGFVSDRLSILDYPEDVRNKLEFEELDFSKAREIAKIDDDGYRNKILTMTVNGAATTQTVREWRMNYERRQRQIEERRKREKERQDQVTAQERDEQQEFKDQVQRQRQQLRGRCMLHGGTVPQDHLMHITVCSACWTILADMQEEIKERVENMEKDMEEIDVDAEAIESGE